MLDQLGAMTQERAQSNQVSLRPKGRGQQAIAVQGLEPLTVQDVGFAPWKTLDSRGADQTALQPLGFQGLEDRDPVDACRFHGHGLDVVRHQPVGQGVQIGGVVAKHAHELGLLRTRHTDGNLMGANVDPGGMWMNVSQALERTHFAAAAALALTEFTHESLPRK